MDKDKIYKDYIEEAARTVRKGFVRDVTAVIEGVPAPRAGQEPPPGAFTKQEQADVLRRMATNLEKSEERAGPVAAAMARKHRAVPPNLSGKGWEQPKVDATNNPMRFFQRGEASPGRLSASAFLNGVAEEAAKQTRPAQSPDRKPKPKR